MSAENQSTVAIKDVNFFDGTQMQHRKTVVIRGTIIADIRENSDAIELDTATFIEGSGMTLIPGLIDSHVHVDGVESLEQSLLFGVTTVLDMFADYRVIAELKKIQDEEIGRRISDVRSAGTLATAPGGHGTEYGLAIPTLTQAEDAPQFVKDRIAEGSDYIKIVYFDGQVSSRTFPAINRSVLSSVISEAHKNDKIVIVHSTCLQGSTEAIESGADGLVHAFVDVPPDASFGPFVKSHNAFMIPTLVVLENLCGIPGGKILLDETPPNFKNVLSKGAIEFLEKSFPESRMRPTNFGYAQQVVSELRKAGVPLLAGTDAGNPGTAFGISLHRELELLAKSGLTPIEALASATSVPCEKFGLSDRGRIREGMRADLLLVDGDPTADIRKTRNVVKVWKLGRLIHNFTSVANQAP